MTIPKNFSFKIQKSADLPANHKANRLFIKTPFGSMDLRGNDEFVVETIKDLINAGGFFAAELRKNLAGLLPAEFEQIINAEYKRIGLPQNFKLTEPPEMLSFEEAEAVRKEIAGIGSETELNVEIAAAFRNLARCRRQVNVTIEENAGEFSEADKQKFKKGLAKAELKILLLETEIENRAEARRAAPSDDYENGFCVVGVDPAREGSDKTAFYIPLPVEEDQFAESRRHFRQAVADVQENILKIHTAEREELERIAATVIKYNLSDVGEHLEAGNQHLPLSGYVEKLLEELNERRRGQFVPVGIPFFEEVKLGELKAGNVFAFAACYVSNEAVLNCLQVLPNDEKGIIKTRDLIKRDQIPQHWNNLEMPVYRFFSLDFSKYEPAREKFRRLNLRLDKHDLENGYSKENLHQYFVQFLNGEVGLANAEVLADLILLTEAETEARIMKRENVRFDRFQQLETNAGALSYDLLSNFVYFLNTKDAVIYRDEKLNELISADYMLDKREVKNLIHEFLNEKQPAPPANKEEKLEYPVNFLKEAFEDQSDLANFISQNFYGPENAGLVGKKASEISKTLLIELLNFRAARDQNCIISRESARILLAEAGEAKFGRADYRSWLDVINRIGEDEPVFIVRAQDVNAPELLEFYSKQNSNNENETVAESARYHRNRMLNWQHNKGNGKLKMPDIDETRTAAGGIVETNNAVIVGRAVVPNAPNEGKQLPYAETVKLSILPVGALFAVSSADTKSGFAHFKVLDNHAGEVSALFVGDDAENDLLTNPQQLFTPADSFEVVLLQMDYEFDSVKVDGLDIPRDVFNWLDALTAEELQQTKRAIDRNFLEENFNISPADAAEAVQTEIGDKLPEQLNRIGKFVETYFGDWLKKEFPNAAPMDLVLIQLIRSLCGAPYLMATPVSLAEVQKGDFFVLIETNSTKAKDLAVYFCVDDEKGIIRAGAVTGENSGNVETFNLPAALDVLRLRITPAVDSTIATYPVYEERILSEEMVSQLQNRAATAKTSSAFKSEVYLPLSENSPLDQTTAGVDLLDKVLAEEFSDLVLELPLSFKNPALTAIDVLKLLQKKYETALDLCRRANNSYSNIETNAPDNSWFETYFELKNEFAVLTEEGWIVGEDARKVPAEDVWRTVYQKQIPPKDRITNYQETRSGEGTQPFKAEYSGDQLRNMTHREFEEKTLGYNPRKQTAAERGNVTSEDVERIKGETKLTAPPPAIVNEPPTKAEENFGEICVAILSVLPYVGGFSVKQIEAAINYPAERIENALEYMKTGAMSATNDFQNLRLVHEPAEGVFIQESHEERFSRCRRESEENKTDQLPELSPAAKFIQEQNAPLVDGEEETKE